MLRGIRPFAWGELEERGKMVQCGPMWASAPTKWGVGADDPCGGVALSV